jgi:hypothetical protein
MLVTTIGEGVILVPKGSVPRRSTLPLVLRTTLLVPANRTVSPRRVHAGGMLGRSHNLDSGPLKSHFLRPLAAPRFRSR